MTTLCLADLDQRELQALHVLRCVPRTSTNVLASWPFTAAVSTPEAQVQGFAAQVPLRSLTPALTSA